MAGMIETFFAEMTTPLWILAVWLVALGILALLATHRQARRVDALVAPPASERAREARAGDGPPQPGGPDR